MYCWKIGTSSQSDMSVSDYFYCVVRFSLPTACPNHHGPLTHLCPSSGTKRIITFFRCPLVFCPPPPHPNLLFTLLLPFRRNRPSITLIGTANIASCLCLAFLNILSCEPASSPSWNIQPFRPIIDGDILSKRAWRGDWALRVSSAEGGGDCERLFALSETLGLEECVLHWW